MKRKVGLLLPFLISLAGLTLIFCLPARKPGSAQAKYLPLTSIEVTTLADELNIDGDCSLREAIAAANTNTNVDACLAGQTLTDTITFQVPGMIIVTSPLTVTAGGPLVIDGQGSITTSGGGGEMIATKVDPLTGESVAITYTLNTSEN